LVILNAHSLHSPNHQDPKKGSYPFFEEASEKGVRPLFPVTKSPISMSADASWRSSRSKRLQARLISTIGYPFIAALGSTLRWRA
jgi:hypothetical protein